MKIIRMDLVAAVASLSVLAGCATGPREVASGAVMGPPSEARVEALVPPEGVAELDRPVPRTLTEEVKAKTVGYTFPPMIVKASATRPSTLRLLMEGQVVRCPGCATCLVDPKRDGWRFDTREHELAYRPTLVFGRTDQEVVVHLVRPDQQARTD